MALLNLKKKSEDPEVAALQEQVAKMEAMNRVRQKYGRISDADVERILKDEQNAVQKAEMKAQMEEASRKAREERDRLIRKTAGEYVGSGRILATVNGIKVEAIGEDCSLPCPECGGPLRDSSAILCEMTERYLLAPAQHKFGPEAGLVIYNAQNPLGWTIGFPGVIRPLTCVSCGKTTPIAVQLVVL